MKANRGLTKPLDKLLEYLADYGEDDTIKKIEAMPKKEQTRLVNSAREVVREWKAKR